MLPITTQPITKSGRILEGNGVGAKPSLVKKPPMAPGVAGPRWEAGANTGRSVLPTGARTGGGRRGSFLRRAKQGAATLVSRYTTRMHMVTMLANQPKETVPFVCCQ